MDSPEWGDKPPETSGWYWLDDKMLDWPPRIVRVEYSATNEALVVADQIDDRGIQRPLSDYPNSRWAGPIPLPPEPDT